MKQSRYIKTFGEVFPKFIIDLVADEGSNESFKLLLWNGEETHVGRSIQVPLGAGNDLRERIFVPPDVDSTVRRAIRFPAHDASYGSCRELFNDICGLIEKFVDLPPKLISLAAYSALASWFSDFTAVPVSVSIVGPSSQQRSNLFRLLSCLYRRSLLLGELSATAICSLPMELCPALFVERYEFSRQSQKVLRATSARDTYIPRKGRLINACCAKVICSEELLGNEELGQSSMIIPVTNTRRPIPILDGSAQQEIASEFQAKLLKFRLTNYNLVRNSKFDVPQFESSARDLARSLGACVSEDPELQENIAPLLEECNEEFQADSECSRYLNELVVEAMFEFCHQKEKASLHVKEITSVVNSILKGRGETFEMTPKQVGNKLRAMGLTTKRLDAYGRGIQLLDPVRHRIHKLAWNYRVGFGGIESDNARIDCSHCATMYRREEKPDPLDSLSREELDTTI
jgi:hypothetical protein